MSKPQPQFVQERLAVGPRREIVVSPMVSFYVLSDEIWFGTCVCVSRDGVEQLNLRFSDPFSRTWAERMRHTARAATTTSLTMASGYPWS